MSCDACGRSGELDQGETVCRPCKMTRGTLVRVGPGYRAAPDLRPNGGTLVPDGYEGVYTVIRIAGDDLVLARGDVRERLDPRGFEHDRVLWDVYMSRRRCTPEVIT